MKSLAVVTASAALVIQLGMMALGTAQVDTFGSGANTFTIDFVTVGNPGNAADTTGDPNPVGSVAYTYNLGKFEISRDQIEKANALWGLQIQMLDSLLEGGNRPDQPAIGITWNQAARFVNALNTSKGYHAAYNFTTSGPNDNISLWSVEDSAQNGTNRFRQKDAYYFLPSVDEWYKGAYYDPNKGGEGVGGYWKYPTGSDTPPTPVSGGTDPNTAVYNQFFDNQYRDPADVNNAGGLSPYGTMAQGGNVQEWNESAFSGAYDSATAPREIRGGAWHFGFAWDTGGLIASTREGLDPDLRFSDDTYYRLGFRVASIPEPSSAFLILLAGGALMLKRLARRSL